MKFLIVHNRYSRTGGEESVVVFQRQLLEREGHTVLLYERSYDETHRWWLGRWRKLFTALRNGQVIRELRQLVERERPDVAIVHNLFPVISPAILPMLKQSGIRVWMSLHNFRLICPTGVFFTHGAICERCGGRGREWHCLLQRCQGSLTGSAAFALRGAWVRGWRYYLGNVDIFLALTEFQRDKLVAYGLPAERFRIIPNAIDPQLMPAPSTPTTCVGYVGWVGRLSQEKGVDLLFEAARRMPQVRFRVAGEKAQGLKHTAKEVPPNVELLGMLDRTQLADFYAGAGVIALTSRCYEGFPLALLEAMYYGKPVVAPRRGGIPEVVEGCGTLNTPDNVEELVRALEEVLNNPEQAAIQGRCGDERVRTRYTPENYYRLLMACYE